MDTTVAVQVYMNNAARQPACPTFLPEEAVSAKQTCSEGTVVAPAKDSTLGSGALQPTGPSAGSLSAGIPDHSQQPSPPAQPASSHDHPEGHTDSAQPSMAAIAMPGLVEEHPQVPQHYRAHLQKPPLLEEAEIDWAGEKSAQPPGQGQAKSDVEPEFHHAGWSDSDAEEYDPEATPQPDEECPDSTHGAVPSAAQHATAMGRSGLAQKDQEHKHEAGVVSCSQNGVHAREGAASAVHDATLRFVKAILKPLFAAEVGCNLWSLHADYALRLAHSTAWAIKLSLQWGIIAQSITCKLPISAGCYRAF